MIELGTGVRVYLAYGVTDMLGKTLQLGVMPKRAQLK